MSYTLHHLALSFLAIVPVCLFAARAARALFPRGDALTRLLAGLLAAFALVTAAGGLLGLVGLLSFAGFLATLWPAAAAMWLIARRAPCAEPAPSGLPSAPWPLKALGLAATTLMVGTLGAKLAQPAIDYDSLTYHLHFPAQWLAAGRVFVVETPFGDAAPAYAPASAELWSAWLMAPWRAAVPNAWAFKLSGLDALAKVGQFPFFVLAIAALTALARRLAGEIWTIYLPAIVFCFTALAPLHAANSAVDLTMGAFLLASCAFAQHYRDDGDRRAALLAGAALGFAAGVKFLALSYAPLCVLPMLWFLARRRDGRAFWLWAAAGAAGSLPWYVRNLVVAGNPVFPLHVSLFGHPLFPGAYTRAAMLASPFHVPDFPAAVMVSVHLIGFWLTPLAALSAPFGLALARREVGWRAWAWLGPVAFAWHYLAVPYSSQARFLLWATALLLLPLAALPRRRVWLSAFAALAAPGVALMLFGGFPVTLGPATAPRFGHLNLAFWRAAAATFALIALSLFLLRRRTSWSPLTSLAAASGLGMLAALAMATTTAGFVRTDLVGLKELPLTAYELVWRAAPRTVAYAGRNRPYYLTGRGGWSRVVYVNPDGRPQKLLCDYVDELERAGLLDRSKEKDNWRGRAPDYAAWRAALEADGVQALFVERLSDAELAYLPHDGDGYPLERGWARGHPEDFAPVVLGGNVEVFAVRSLVGEAI